MEGADDTGAQPRGVVVVGRFAELEDALVERVLELRGDRPLTPLTVVVGSAPVRTHVGDLLVRRLGAVANVAVVTLGRFAGDVVARARGAPPAPLDDLTHARLARQVASAPPGGVLRYFSRVVERPHFADALAATFADLREAGVAPGSGWERHVEADGAGAKGRDLGVLYAAYCARLDRLALHDRAGVFLAAAEAFREGLHGGRGPLAGDVVLYGIYDLNEAQERFLSLVLAAGADALVPAADGDDETLLTLLAAARRAGLRERRATPPSAARTDRELVGLLARPGTRATPAVRLAGDGSLGVVSVSDERAETREAVRAVLAAVEAGATAWDCAVVVPHADDVERLASGLAEAGLPVAARRPDRSLGRRIVARLLDCLAPAAGAPLARRAVVELACTAPLTMTTAGPREAALWLDEARRAGVVAGAQEWRDRMARRRDDLARRVTELERGGEDAATADDDGSAAPLDDARARLAAAQALAAAATALGGATDELPARGTWRAWAAALSAVVATLFTADAAAAAAAVIGRLDALDVLGEEVALSDVAVVLREQLAGATVQHGRVGRDGVAVLTPDALRGLRFHTVVFCDLAEGGFPMRGRPDPLLGDAARRRITEALGVRLPLAETRDAESHLLFALACDAARQRLVLLAPRTDGATGRPRLPSRSLLRVASAQAGRPVGLEEFLSGAPLKGVWRRAASSSAPVADAVWIDARERDVAVLQGLGRARGGPGRAYLGLVIGDEGVAERRLGAWRAGRSPQPGPWDGLLGGEARAALTARRLFAAETHPTRLERYITCPFAFLVQDVLGLEAPDEPGSGLDMDPGEFGTLVHAILETTYAAVISGDLGLHEAQAALERSWELECATAERRGITGSALAWEVRRRLLLDDLRKALDRDPVFRCADERPILVEWRFGERHGRPVVLDVGDAVSVRFAGRLDRVDRVPEGVRIIDYKTGKGTLEAQRLKDGLSVQLPVYQLALRQAGEDTYASIRCVYRLVTRRGRFTDLPLDEDEETAAGRLQRVVAAIAGLVDAGVFARAPAGRCEYCDVAYACGLTSWARARKRGHHDLAALAALQAGDLEREDDDDGV